MTFTLFLAVILGACQKENGRTAEPEQAINHMTALPDNSTTGNILRQQIAFPYLTDYFTQNLQNYANQIIYICPDDSPRCCDAVFTRPNSASLTYFVAKGRQCRNQCPVAA
ncbi:MAG: hypothetical protein MJZ76_06235 [Bacteroidales bacterium]|nr:hypothetical protein [Bacteroidales bacterium]